jgi:hypothetical protein
VKKVYWVSISHWGLFPWVALPSYAPDAEEDCEDSNTKSYKEALAYDHHVNQNKRRK